MYSSIDLAAYDRLKTHRIDPFPSLGKETWEKRNNFINGIKYDTMKQVEKGLLMKPLKVLLDNKLQPVKEETPAVFSDFVPFIMETDKGLVIVEFDSKSRDSGSGYDKLSYVNALWKAVFVSASTSRDDCSLLYCYKSLSGYSSRMIEGINYQEYEEEAHEFYDYIESFSFGDVDDMDGHNVEFRGIESEGGVNGGQKNENSSNT